MALLILLATLNASVLTDAANASAQPSADLAVVASPLRETTGPWDGGGPWMLANLWVVQDRIVLKRGEGGGVTIKPDPRRAVPSYDHSSRPLFGTQTGYAAQRSRQRYSPPPPLITSREVARETVWRSAYGGRGRYGRWSF